MAYDADPVIHALVEFADPVVSAVALNLFFTWLYDKFKGSRTTYKRLNINEEWTELTPEGISRTIKKSIEYEKKS